jgi:integrase
MKNRALEHLEEFLAYRKIRISPNFYRDTDAVLHAWLRESGITCIRTITQAQLEHWFNHKCESVKVATAASYLMWIRVFLDWCVRQHIISTNPVSLVEVPKFKKPYRRVFISKAMVKILIDECEDMELKYCLYCGFHAGLRFNEVVMSRPEWFDLAEGLLHVTRFEGFETKDGDDRTIPLTKDFQAFLRVYGFKVPYMIGPHKKEGKRYRYTFERRFDSYIQSHNLSITFHDLRRTFASLHVSAGTSLYKVAKWLGDGIQVTEKHYGHLEPADVEINKAFL